METEKELVNKVVEYNPIEAGLLKLKEALKEVPDATKPEGYNQIKSTLKSGRDLKSLLVATHKATKAEALAFCKKVDGEKNRIQSELETMIAPHKAAKVEEDERKARIEEEEANEAAERLAAIQKRIEGFKEILYKATGKTSKEVDIMLTALKRQEINKDIYGDFEAEAHAHKSTVRGKLETLLESTRSQEETEIRLLKQEKELEEMREKTRIEDEQREVLRQRQIDADNKKRDEENARLKEENDKIKADLEYAQAKQREAQEKIDADNKRITDENNRIENEKAQIEATKELTRLKIIKDKEAEIGRFKNWIDASHNLKDIGKLLIHLDKFEETGKSITEEKFGDQFKDALNEWNRVYSVISGIIGEEKQNKEDDIKHEAEENRLREEALELAEAEAALRKAILREALEDFGMKDGVVDRFIDLTQNELIPYLRIDWTKE